MSGSAHVHLFVIEKNTETTETEAKQKKKPTKYNPTDE